MSLTTRQQVSPQMCELSDVCKCFQVVESPRIHSWDAAQGGQSVVEVSPTQHERTQLTGMRHHARPDRSETNTGTNMVSQHLTWFTASGKF